MTALINRLTRDHGRFGRIMSLLEGLLERFQAGDEPDYSLTCELLEYVVDYADQVHHPSEELIFARLRERLAPAPGAPDASASLSAELDRFSDQHRELERINRAFRDALEGIMHEAVLSRDEVAEQGRAMIDLMRRHIAAEEARVFPTARARLTEADWASLEQQAPSAADPVFGQLDPLRFRTLYDYLKDELDTEDGAPN